jgi:conjugative transfer signal peptidase TraF
VTRVELIWLGTTIVVLGAIATVAAQPTPVLVWNVTPSAPVGLYFVTPDSEPARGTLAIARLPRRWRMLAAARGYIPANVPLVKHVAAISGDRVCAARGTITIIGRFAARALPHDRRGRPLPSWQGCVTLARHQMFLLGEARDSFDGRYFGVIESSLLIGRARLLWRR